MSKNNVPLTRFRSQKEAALLIYLAHNEDTYQREYIADLLWESSSTKQALSNLRTILARMRRHLGEDAFELTRKTISLNQEQTQPADSVLLLKGLAQIKGVDSAETANSLMAQLEAYTGEFCTNFYLKDGDNFNYWLTQTQEEIRRTVVLGYEKLSRYAQSQQDVELTIEVAQNWLKVDELNEAPHTLLIRNLIGHGKPEQAKMQYELCTSLFKNELGLEPPAAATALIQAIQPKRMTLTIGTEPDKVRHNLPAEYDQFFGRNKDIKEIHGRLNQANCRLVTLVGQGGMGKTRLATHIAWSRLNQHPNGVWLVELDQIDVDDPDIGEAIAVEIATILALRLTGVGTPAEQLINHLKHQQTLLVLDNFEQLIPDGIDLIVEITKRCPLVQLIITSRERLNIRAEWTVELRGLSYPAESEADEQQTSETGELENHAVENSHDAVDLFLARYAQHHHEPMESEGFGAVRAICRIVEGLPLALELAAGLTPKMSLNEIVQSLGKGFGALETRLRDMPQRHRSLFVVFDMSWGALPQDLQQKLARLSVFRGGFRAEAAQQITLARPADLSGLLEKSLMRHHVDTGRYSLHPVVQTYAGEHLPQPSPTHAKHTGFYLDLLAAHTEPLQKDKPQDSMAIIEPDIDNVRAAWLSGISRQEAAGLLGALTSLSIVYQLRGWSFEGESVMGQTAEAAAGWGDDGVRLVGRAGLERARFLNRLGRYRPAISAVEKAIKLAESIDDQWGVGMGTVWWGESLWRMGEYGKAKAKLNDALGLGQVLEAKRIIGWSHHQLGIICDVQGQYDDARSHFQEAIDIWRDIEDLKILATSLNSVGLVNYHQGDLASAQNSLEETLSLTQQFNNHHLQTSTLNNLSIIATEMSDFMGAQYYLRLGYHLATISSDLSAQGHIQINLGKNLRLSGQLQDAFVSLDNGLEISRILGDQSMQASAFLNLAQAHQASGSFEQAEQFFKKALDISRENNFSNIACDSLIGLAEILNKFDKNEAKRYSEEAVLQAKAIQNPELIQRAKAIDQLVI